MQTSNNQGAIVPLATTTITPAYQKAIATTAEHYKTMTAFVSAQMQQGIDYGTIPGTKKPTLLKPGAEKLCRLFNLRPNFNLIQSVVDVSNGYLTVFPSGYRSNSNGFRCGNLENQ